ncbi:MAG TPA: SRPBCC family protein [Rhizomicrobium sp.]|nr:SRPBCC family protein [Rhizomicrobium sp.]
MAQTNDNPAGPLPLKISRTFHVPRAVVFKAWSSAEHIRRWFCPADCTIPEARVEMRVGGPFEVRMCGPEGTDHWSRGAFAEVSPHDRLVLDLRVSDGEGRALFRAWTEVNFADVPGGTRMDVIQSYTFENPSEAERMLALAPRGWSETLDRLGAELVRMQGGGEHKARSVVHAIFSLERTYDAPVERVFRALSDETAKSKWFAGEEGRWQPMERLMDFRVGGRERVKGRWDGGVVSTFDAVYHDIIANERIIYTYEMHLDEMKISVSLATLQLRAETARRTTLKISEQGAFLDGYDDAGSREHGTGFLLDRLGASLAE